MAKRQVQRPQRPDGELERGLAAFAAAERRSVLRRIDLTARAVQDERLRYLEKDLVELRGRVHGLLFLMIGAVVTQVIVRLWG